MKPFTVVEGIALPLIRPNIDTDAIIPSREMRSVTRSGLADGLFAGWRYLSIGSRTPNPDFVLNDPAYASACFLLAGENVGCGSSREHAVWALAEYGFRAVLAPSFNPIFETNCIRNGIAPVMLSLSEIDDIARCATGPGGPHPITVDLEAQRVLAPGGRVMSFEIAREAKAMLVGGLDPVDLTLTLTDQIRTFVARDRAARSWAYLT